MSLSVEGLLGYAVRANGLAACLDEIESRLWLDQPVKGHLKSPHPGPLPVEEGMNPSLPSRLSGMRPGCGAWLACLNPHSVVRAGKDPAFKRALWAADWLIPDGAGIVLASRWLGGRITRRVTGSDVFQGLNERMNARGGLSCFFLGSNEETLETIRARMARDYPNVRVAGTYSPPYRDEFSPEESAAMLAAIAAAQPDVLWVGMTAPKQEKWLHQHQERLAVPFAAAVGAVFDFYSGNVKRSHPFFLRYGLEWLPRLLREPRRLWRRNLVSTPLFLAQVAREVLRRRLRVGH